VTLARWILLLTLAFSLHTTWVPCGLQLVSTHFGSSWDRQTNGFRTIGHGGIVSGGNLRACGICPLRRYPPHVLPPTDCACVVIMVGTWHPDHNLRSDRSRGRQCRSVSTRRWVSPRGATDTFADALGKVALITLYAVLMLWMTVVGFAGSTN
jgi:hypothetical protein